MVLCMIQIKNTSEIIDEALKKSKKLREVYLKAKWNEVVGDSLTERCYPLKIIDECLYVVADTSSVANYLRMSQEDIIFKVNRILKDEIIKDIRIKIGVMEKR